MAEINWNALQAPDFAAGALQAERVGQQQGVAAARRNALRTYTTDPTAGISQLMAVDPEAAIRLKGVQRQDHQDAGRTQAVEALTGGDTQGAQRIALASDNADLATAIGTMDKQSREAAKARAEALANVGFSLKGLPYEARRAKLAEFAPRAQELGLTPDQLAGFDPTDGNIDQQVSQALTIKEHLDQADKQADNARADDLAAESKRHNRVGEGISARNASTSAFAAQTGRMSFEERKKQKGFGTPGSPVDGDGIVWDQN